MQVDVANLLRVPPAAVSIQLEVGSVRVAIKAAMSDAAAAAAATATLRGDVAVLRTVLSADVRAAIAVRSWALAVDAPSPLPPSPLEPPPPTPPPVPPPEQLDAASGVSAQSGREASSSEFGWFAFGMATLATALLACCCCWRYRRQLCCPFAPAGGVKGERPPPAHEEVSLSVLPMVAIDDGAIDHFDREAATAAAAAAATATPPTARRGHMTRTAPSRDIRTASAEARPSFGAIGSRFVSMPYKALRRMSSFGLAGGGGEGLSSPAPEARGANRRRSRNRCAVGTSGPSSDAGVIVAVPSVVSTVHQGLRAVGLDGAAALPSAVTEGDGENKDAPPLAASAVTALPPTAREAADEEREPLTPTRTRAAPSGVLHI